MKTPDRPKVILGQPCPRCRRVVKSRDHWYSVHTRKGRQRNKVYEESERAKARQFRYLDRRRRRQAHCPHPHLGLTATGRKKCQECRYVLPLPREEVMAHIRAALAKRRRRRA